MGFPVFLAYPILWLGLRPLFSASHSRGRSFWPLLVLASISGIGTALVEAPFVALRAGTSGLQRFEVIVLWLGILAAGISVLLARRRWIGSGDAALMGMITAYLANLAICLIVYSEARGSVWSRAGWLASTVLVVPMGAEWLWLLFKMWSLPAEVAQ